MPLYEFHALLVLSATENSCRQGGLHHEPETGSSQGISLSVALKLKILLT